MPSRTPKQRSAGKSPRTPARPQIVYAGDGPVDGAARYLLGCLKAFGADVVHRPPLATLPASVFKPRPDAIILSDMPAAKVPAATQKRIAECVEEGAGLLMVGGWASFSGPAAGWRGSLVEGLLPVRSLGRDDRTNFPSGALLISGLHHAILDGKALDRPPAICGLNHFLPRPGAQVILSAAPIRARRLPSGTVAPTLESPTLPLLVVSADPKRRTAAFATDFAPHWCGGLVDWGENTMRIEVSKGNAIEVGSDYVAFVGRLLGWLTGRA
jgi:uncharacterized membrane protein